MQKYLVLISVFLTGLCGLVYEVTWQRYVAALIGSHAKSTALVLGVFLGGLGIGYWMFGKISRNRSDIFLVKSFGWCEIGIGAWAILFPTLYEYVSLLSVSYGAASYFSFFGDLFVASILMVFPSVLMGATLPLLTQGMAIDGRDARQFHARIYAINTLGAFAGCLLAGFYLVPEFGLPLTMMSSSIVNILVGTIVLALAPRLCLQVSDTPSNHVVQPDSNSEPVLTPGSARWLSFCFGLCSIALQTVFIRVVGLTMGSSEYAFSMIVAVYILLLALGSWQIRNSEMSVQRLLQNQIVLFFSLAVVYFTVPYWGYFNHLIRIHLRDIDSGFYVLHAFLFLLISLLLYVPVMALGKNMPMIFTLAGKSKSESGGAVGSLYAWNTLGCVAGAFCGFFALYFIDLDRLFSLALVVLFGAMFLLNLAHAAELSRQIRTIGPLVMVVVLLFVAVNPWNRDWLALGLFRQRHPFSASFSGAEAAFKAYLGTNKVIAYKDDPNTTVAVLESGGRSRYVRSIVVNGKSDGSTSGGDLKTVQLLGHLGALLNKGNSGHVAVVGFGTGITAGAFTNYDSVTKIDIFEIAPFVKKFSSLFDFANHDVSKNPKVLWHIGDAYRGLISSEKAYDVIVSEPSNPWVSGVEKLFSAEFYERVAGKLAPGGVFVQWFHLYDSSPDSFGLVGQTFTSRFKYARMFRADTADIIWIGSNQPIDAGEIDFRWNRNHVARHDLSTVGINAVDTLLAHELPVNPRIFAGMGSHSLEFPKLAFAAGRDFFKGQMTDVDSFVRLPPVKPWLAVSQQQLLSSERRSTLASEESIEKQISLICGSSRIDELSKPFRTNAECQNLLAAHVGTVGRKFDGLFGDQVVTLLRYLSTKNSSQKPPVVRDIEDATDIISTFDRSSSGFLTLSGDKLIGLVSPVCPLEVKITAIRCRINLVVTLAANGNPALAEEQLQGLLKTIPEGFLSENFSSDLEVANEVLATSREVSLMQ